MSDLANNLKSLFGAKSDVRYEAFLEMVHEAGSVWVLKDDEGCLIVTSDDEECLPVWPSEEAALACAIADWKGLEPLAVSMADWMEKWLPGMEKDNRVVAVFPNLAGESLVVEARELYEELDG